MAFRVPTFNLTCNLYRNPIAIPGPPTSTFMVNLSAGRRVMESGAGSFFFIGYAQVCYALCPKLTDIRAMSNFAPVDILEIPAASGRYYYAMHVMDVAKGFANEYREVVLIQVNADTILALPYPAGIPLWPVPTP